jgi:hypothetical protein
MDCWGLQGRQALTAHRYCCRSCGWVSCFETKKFLSEILLFNNALQPISSRISSATIMNGSIFHFHLSAHKKTSQILLFVTSRPPFTVGRTVADWPNWSLPSFTLCIAMFLAPSSVQSDFLHEAILFISRIRDTMRWIFKFTLSFRPYYALGYIQPLTEMSTRNIKIIM